MVKIAAATVHPSEILRQLLYIRIVEERICELYGQQQMRCPVHISIGQEATAVGVCMNLTGSDLVFSNHRSHGHYLAKGGNLNAFFAEIYGRKSGCSSGRGGSMHLIDLDAGFMGSTPIVGSTIPLAVGAALSIKMQRRDNVSVVFFGDGATEEGVFHESLNFAKLKRLPVLFFCENNLYSVYTGLGERQPERRIIELAKAHGIASFNVDGNNVLEVYNVSRKALEIIHSGNGPVFIEAATYRWREHCGVNYDNHLGYRPMEEFLSWKERDPVENFKEFVKAQGWTTESDIKRMEAEILQKVDDAVSFAESSEFPGKEELDKNLFSGK